MYVTVVLDLYSRRIVSWPMPASMTAQLVDAFDYIERFYNTRRRHSTFGSQLRSAKIYETHVDQVSGNVGEYQWRSESFFGVVFMRRITFLPTGLKTQSDPENSPSQVLTVHSRPWTPKIRNQRKTAHLARFS
ncbi:MAG: hypothetical protein QM661_00655 [Solimonas sp.]